MCTLDPYRTTTSLSFTKVSERRLKTVPQSLCQDVCVVSKNTFCQSPSVCSSSLTPLHTYRCPCATRHRHSLPTVLAHTGRHREEHAPSHCGEPDQDYGCVSGRISGLLNAKHRQMFVMEVLVLGSHWWRVINDQHDFGVLQEGPSELYCTGLPVTLYQTRETEMWWMNRRPLSKWVNSSGIMVVGKVG